MVVKLKFSKSLNVMQKMVA